MTPEWSLVIEGHTDYSESGASISELNSVTGCNLRAAVHPDVRERRSRGGAGQTDRAERQHVCAAGSCYYIRYRLCGMNPIKH